MYYIIYVGYGHWYTTDAAYKVTGGSVQVNASIRSIEAIVKYTNTSKCIGQF